MTYPDGNPGDRPPSDASSGSAEPSSSGYDTPGTGGHEDPTIQHQASDVPPAYAAPPAYPPPGFAPPDYPPPAYPDPGYAPAPYQPSSPYESPYPPPAGVGSPSPQYGGFGPGDGTPPPAGYPPPAGPAGYPPQAPGFGTGPGYPAPGYYGGYGAPSAPTNGMAIASLVSSGLGLGCFIFSIVGIVLGIVALSQIKQNRDGGQGLAIAGIAVGGVTLVGNLIFLLLLAAASGST